MEREEIIKEAERIEKKINSYYKDRQITVVSATGIRNITTENINPDKKYDHPYINVKEIGHVMPSRIESLLVEDCYTYLCFHEFFHITNGHCDLITKLQMERLNEVSDKIGETPELVRQTLEYDADCCAIASMVNEQLRNAGIINNQFGINTRISVNSLAQTMSHILISIFLINSLFYDEFKKVTHCTLEDTINLAERLYHPLPGMRVMYMMLNMDCIIGQCGMYSQKETMEIFERMFDSLKSFTKEYKDVIHSEFLKVAIDKKGMAHMQRIHDNWDKIMKEIPISYSTLSPYAKCDYEAMLKGE